MKIGEREVLHTALLLIPDGEDAWVELRIGQWQLRFQVLLKNEDTADKSASIVIDDAGGHGRITLINWQNPLGTATPTPIEVAVTNVGEKLVLMAWHGKTGTVNRLHLQFSLEVKE